MKLLLKYVFSLLACTFFLFNAHATIAYTNSYLRFSTSFGREIVAKVKTPVGSCSEKKFPALLIFGGFQQAAQVLDLVDSPVPIVLASFDYPFDPPRKFSLPESLKYAPQVKAMIRDTVDGIKILRSRLAQMQCVDESKITVVGASLGAPFAIAAVAQDPDFSALVVVHGFGKIRMTAMHQMLRSWKPKWGIASYIPAWLISNLGWLYLMPTETEEDARDLHEMQKVLVIQAENDEFIPIEASEVLWNAVSKSKAVSERIIMPGNHVQPGSEAKIKIILSMINDWMKRRGLLADR